MCYFSSLPQISDLKRLNKIEKEIEIHARKTLKVPANAQSILLTTHDELPSVHKSGQSSPKVFNTSQNHVLSSNKLQLDEKLLVASVSLSGGPSSQTNSRLPELTEDQSINDIIFKSAMAGKEHEFDGSESESLRIDHDVTITQPLLSDDQPNRNFAAVGPHSIRGAPRSDLSCSGSDCDISWIFLLIFILGLCFAIPLIYVFYIAEHPNLFHHNE